MDHLELKERSENHDEAKKTAAKRLTLRLAPAAVETLDWIAEARGGATYGQVISRALGTERFLMEKIAAGAAIVIEEPGQRPKELLLRG